MTSYAVGVMQMHAYAFRYAGREPFSPPAIPRISCQKPESDVEVLYAPLRCYDFYDIPDATTPPTMDFDVIVATAAKMYDALHRKLTEITIVLGDIRDSVTVPTPRQYTQEDVEDRAIHYLFSVGPNITEIWRRLERDGIKVRRQSLTEARKFARFQEKLELFRRNGELPKGYLTDEGDVEACDATDCE